MEARPRCSVGITPKVLEILVDDLGLNVESNMRRVMTDREIRRFIAEDMNSDSTVERYMENLGTMEQRVRPAHYFVLGSTYRYHVVKIDRGGYEPLTIVNAIKPGNCCANRSHRPPTERAAKRPSRSEVSSAKRRNSKASMYAGESVIGSFVGGAALRSHRPT